LALAKLKEGMDAINKSLNAVVSGKIKEYFVASETY
jgi:hypothetical protein